VTDGDKLKLRNIAINYDTAIQTLTTKLQLDIANAKKLLVPYRSKKALLIGSNYNGTKLRVSSCMNDIRSMSSLLSSRYKFNVKTVSDTSSVKPTRQNVLNAITTFVADANSGDLLFLMFSGHGGYIFDETSSDELGYYDQTIICSDLKPILDDELRAILQKNLKKGVTLFAMFDSCYSGSILDLRYKYDPTGNMTVNTKNIDTVGTVILIGASADNKVALSAKINGIYNGALTWAILRCIQQNISWYQLVLNTNKMLKNNGFTQIVQLSSGMSLNPVSTGFNP
jgi:hypothetical protein